MDYDVDHIHGGSIQPIFLSHFTPTPHHFAKSKRTISRMRQIRDFVPIMMEVVYVHIWLYIT